MATQIEIRMTNLTQHALELPLQSVPTYPVPSRRPPRHVKADAQRASENRWEIPVALGGTDTRVRPWSRCCAAQSTHECCSARGAQTQCRVTRIGQRRLQPGRCGAVPWPGTARRIRGNPGAHHMVAGDSSDEFSSAIVRYLDIKCGLEFAAAACG